IRLHCRQRVGPELKKTVYGRAGASSDLKDRSVATQVASRGECGIDPFWIPGPRAVIVGGVRAESLTTKISGKLRSSHKSPPVAGWAEADASAGVMNKDAVLDNNIETGVLLKRAPASVN